MVLTCYQYSHNVIFDQKALQSLGILKWCIVGYFLAGLIVVPLLNFWIPIVYYDVWLLGFGGGQPLPPPPQSRCMTSSIFSAGRYICTRPTNDPPRNFHWRADKSLCWVHFLQHALLLKPLIMVMVLLELSESENDSKSQPTQSSSLCPQV